MALRRTHVHLAPCSELQKQNSLFRRYQDLPAIPTSVRQRAYSAYAEFVPEHRQPLRFHVGFSIGWDGFQKVRTDKNGTQSEASQ